MQRQKGFLMVTVIILIVIIALLGSALISIFIRSTEATMQLRAIPAASALAESGLEQAQKNFSITDFTARQTCTSLANTVSLTTGDSITSIGTNTVNNPRYAFATLTTAIANNTTPSTITVNDTSVFSTDGWILIGKEVFQYTRIANSTTLAGISRAQDGSIATDHTSGVTVSQYQCAMAGIGHAPGTNTLSNREYQRSMRQSMVFSVGQGGMLLRWNGPASELLWETQNSGTVQDLNAISALNYHSAWAVGNNSSLGFVFSRLQGNTWSPVNVALGSETNLLAIDATSSKEAWAAGERTGGNIIALLRWTRNATNDSTNWCRVPCSGIALVEAGVQPSRKNILTLKTLDLNGDGYADVGYAAGGSADEGNKAGVIWYYAANQWGPIDKAPLNFNGMSANTGQIRGLDFVRNGVSNPKEVFFAGQHSVAGGQLLRLRISGGVDSWTAFQTSADLRAISVVDEDKDGFADYGCAVGDGGYVVCFDNTFTKSFFTLVGDLKSVLVLSRSDIWVTGTGGVRYHYNGTTWTSLTNNVTTTGTLSAIVGIFPNQVQLSAWHELIN